jgi:DNA-directed RNA polymerase subunit L
MELKVLEKKPDKIRVEVLGEDHTLLNIITEYAWEAKAKQASYIIQHPYLSQPELIVKSANAKKTLSDAAQLVMDKSKEFKVSFERALKK